MSNPSVLPPSIQRYNRFLLVVAGLGGLLYGIDVGIIAGALPYLDATSGLNPGQLSIIVAAVLLGSVISTLFAGMLSDLLGRKPIMILSGVLFVASIPMIALSNGFGPIVLGRLLQGISAGVVGVVVPLYLAECLGASNRGKGTGIFQWLLTLGIVIAAVIASVGLAQNLGALRALATEGIQRGHMTLHARQVAIAAGAAENQVDRLAALLVKEKNVRIERAQELLIEMNKK